MHSIRKPVYLGVEVGVSQLDNSISVSSVVVSQWVWFEYGLCIWMLHTRVVRFVSPLFPNQWVYG